MQFYPITFDITPETREIATSISGKKMALSDVQVNMRGVMCKQHGVVTEFDAPHFKLERSGAGYKLTWDRELDQTLEVVLEAQGNGGQTVRAQLFLRIAEPEVVEESPLALASPMEKYKALREAGFTGDDAMKAIETLGEEAATDVKEQLAKALTV